MKKSICFDYKYDSPTSERIRLIEEVGFDAVYLHSQYDPAAYIDVIRRTSGVEIESLHLPYKKLSHGKTVDSRYVNVLWLDEGESRAYVDELIKAVRFASSNGIGIVVMHVTGGDNPPPLGGNGIRSIGKILEECEKNDVVLCLENLRRLDYLDYVFSNLPSDNLMFCFDTGHANCMTKNLGSFPWERYRHKLRYLHLSDNDGEADLHLPPFDGIIDWDPLIKKVMGYNSQLSLTLEVRSSEETREQLTERDYLERCLESLVALERILQV